jgi:hypothetical protein
MQVKAFLKEFVAFSGFTIADLANKGYLERINLLKEPFVEKLGSSASAYAEETNLNACFCRSLEQKNYLPIMPVPIKKGNPQQGRDVKFNRVKQSECSLNVISLLLTRMVLRAKKN